MSKNRNLLGGSLVRHSKVIAYEQSKPCSFIKYHEKEGKGSARSWADCQVLSDELEIGAAQI